MNETERQALVERITLDLFGGQSRIAGVVQTVVDTICDRHGWTPSAWKGQS